MTTIHLPDAEPGTSFTIKNTGDNPLYIQPNQGNLGAGDTAEWMGWKESKEAFWVRYDA